MFFDELVHVLETPDSTNESLSDAIAELRNWDVLIPGELQSRFDRHEITRFDFAANLRELKFPGLEQA